MLDGCNYDIIRIELSVFNERYKSFDMNKCLETEGTLGKVRTLNKKKDDIFNNYKCFHMTYENNTEKKHYNQKSKEIQSSNKNTNRLHIISMNFSDEVKFKKQFTGLLNKLTEKNKSSLMPKIIDIVNNSQSEMRKEYYNIVWQFIEKSSEDQYIDLLKLVCDMETLKENFDTYVLNKGWYPSDNFLSQDILSTNEELYETYCLFVKWKKGITNVNKTWCSLFNNENIDKLLNDLYELFMQYDNVYKHITDFALEQILYILKNFKRPEIIDNFKSLNVNNFESSSKFLILNITEIK